MSEKKRVQHRPHLAGTSTLGGVEYFVTVLACAWVVVYPWLIGGRFWWSQVLGAAVGAAALIAAVSKRENRRVLMRFPIFWLGLIFMAYIVCQALNPWIIATQVAPGVEAWGLQFPLHVNWLPAGISADFFSFNTWRDLIYWLGPWLLGCAWWVAVRRRRSTYWLWSLVLLDGMAIALVSIGYIYFPTKKVLWFYIVPGTEFWVTVAQTEVNYAGPFVYANAAAFFLYISLAVGLALAIHIIERERMVNRDSGFYWVILLGCAVVMSGLLISGSRGGLVIGGIILLVSLGKLVWDNLREQSFSLLRLLPGTVILGAVLAAMVSLFIVVKPKSVTRLVWETAKVKDNGRLELWRPTLMMIKDRPWLGFGGGSFRYISPFYFRKAGVFTDPNSYDGLNRRADRAHSDWLEFVVQYGSLGAIWPLLMLLYWAGYALRMAAWLGASGWMVLLGLGMLVVHAAADFPFFCAPIVTLFTVLLCATMKMAQLSRNFETGKQ